MSTSGTWDFSFSDTSFLTLFFLLFLVFAVFSSAANGLLFFLTLRYKQHLWQPSYLLVTNLSACGIGMSFVTTSVILSSVIREQTQVFGGWCITQFCVLRCFFLTSQATLALMAIERYIFICRGIHYLRMIDTFRVKLSIGLAWAISGGVSVQGGVVLSQVQNSSEKQTNGLLCDAFTINGHIRLSKTEFIKMFCPPSVITAACILTILYCYGCVYHAALRVNITLKQNNLCANRTVGFYFLMFLLQLSVNTLFIVFTLMGKEETFFFCRNFGSIVTPLLIIIPPCIIAAFFLMRDPQIKQLVSAACLQRCSSTAVTELNQTRDGPGWMHETSPEDGPTGQVEGESIEMSTLPGNLVQSISIILYSISSDSSFDQNQQEQERRMPISMM